MIQWLINKDSHLFRSQMNQWCWMNQLSKWFNDSLIKIAICFVHKWISDVEWISWVNDSMTHSQRQLLFVLITNESVMLKTSAQMYVFFLRSNTTIYTAYLIQNGNFKIIINNSNRCKHDLNLTLSHLRLFRSWFCMQFVCLINICINLHKTQLLSVNNN